MLTRGGVFGTHLPVDDDATADIASADLRSVTFAGQHTDAAQYLAERGWTMRSAEIADVFNAAGRPAPTADGIIELASFTRMLSGVRI